MATAPLAKGIGLRLLLELYGHLNPMPFETATQMERDLAKDLRRAGYTITARALANYGCPGGGSSLQRDCVLNSSFG
jgi:hypothetical protein